MNAPSRRSGSDSDLAALERTAADWLVRSDGGLDAAESAALADWLQADARHRAIFDELRRTWDLLPAAAREVAAAGQLKKRPARSFAWFPATLAAAASLAVVVWWSSYESRSLRFNEIAATEVGTLKKMELPDGSVLRLNADSAVEVAYSNEERRVRLVRGEIHLDVAKNPARPFIVSAGAVSVQAVGTAFDVRLRANRSVDVLVTEGQVRVDDSTTKQSLLAVPAEPGRVPLLVAGQRAQIAIPELALAPVAADVMTVTEAELDAALAWHRRQLQFVSVPLAEIVAQFNRHNSHQLVIADTALGAQRFGGTFLAGDYVTFVRLLETSFGVRAERRDGETLLRLK